MVHRSGGIVAALGLLCALAPAQNFIFFGGYPRETNIESRGEVMVGNITLIAGAVSFGGRLQAASRTSGWRLYDSPLYHSGVALATDAEGTFFVGNSWDSAGMVRATGFARFGNWLFDLPSGGVESMLGGMDPSGQVVVGSYRVGATWRPISWVGGAPMDLGLPEGSDWGRATELSADAQTIVGEVAAPFGSKAAVWRGTTITKLRDPAPNTTGATAVDVSADGSILFGNSYEARDGGPETSSRSFPWRGTASDPRLLPTPLGDAYARIVHGNDLGTRAGGTYRVGSGPDDYRAFVWDEANGEAWDLRSLLLAQGHREVERVQILSAQNCTRDGVFWTGVAKDPNGRKRAFLCFVRNETFPASVLNGFGLDESEFYAGRRAVVQVSIPRAAPAGGTEVALTSSSINFPLPATATIPAGERSTRLFVRTLRTSVDKTVRITASYGGVTQTLRPRLESFPLGRLTLSRNRVVGGGDVTATLTFTRPLSRPTIIETRSSDYSLAWLPGQVLAPVGATSVEVPITTYLPASPDTRVAITVGLGGASRTVGLRLDR